ncbi:MAG: efflux RND transporter periplasmic adaptor subunit [Bacteroidia bacterium]|nr:efflux RND transporter periplasmic adaptor subunit [Bacteroidia bacterium]
MKNIIKKNFKIIVVISIAATVFYSCGNKKPDEQSGHNDSVHAEEAEIKLTDEQIKAIGIELGTISYRNLKTALKVNGKLELPPQNKAQVSVLIGGIVKDIPVMEGQFVNKGQTLAILENAEFLQTQQEYFSAKANLTFTKAEYERQKELQKENINATKTFQKAEAEYRLQISNCNSLKEKLKLYNVNPDILTAENIKSSFSIVAPITGYIKRINLFIGKFAEPNLPQFEIVDNRFLHIDLTIYEQDVAKVHEGQQLTFSIINDPHSKHTATIFSINKAFEDNSQAVIAHAKINDVDDNLLPGMFIEARLQIDDYRTMSLPDAAIVSNGAEHYIYVEHEKNSFKQVQVKTGTTDMGFTEIIPTEKISDTDKIAINGAYYLLSQLTKGEGEHHD